MMNRTQKAEAFLALHEAPGCFVMPNPWDLGSARMLAGMGFKALATTSAGMNFAAGRPDGAETLSSVLDHCRELADAVEVPLSADFEDGYAATPEGVADNIRRAAETGLAGGSIEDYDGTRIYDLGEAVERMAAASEAARALPAPYVLTGRAENLIRGNPDLADTIKRLQAYQEAGADVLYAPGLKTAEDIRAVVSSVDRPVNVLAGLPGMTLKVPDFADLGVKRLSVGGSLFRAGFGSVMEAAREMMEDGAFTWVNGLPPVGDVNALFEGTDL